MAVTTEEIERRREQMRELGIARRTHGMRKTPVWGVWWQMIQRCRNERHPAFKDYGARGIRVCERWQRFENFYADMGPRPDGLTLERVDNDGNYEPGNCKWASRVEQHRNRRSTHFIEWNGERLPISVWDERLGYSKGTLAKRLRNGWTLEHAMIPYDEFYFWKVPNPSAADEG